MHLLLLAACTGGADKLDDTAADTTADTAADTDTDTDDTGGEPGTVTLGESCPLTTRLGELRLLASGADVYLDGKIWDRPDPWIGPPELETSTCAFHRFSTESCGTCDPGEVCGFDGACVPERRALTDATLTLTVGGAEHTFTADGTTGDLYGTAGAADDTYALALTFGGQSVTVPALSVAGALPGVHIVATGDSMAPGDLAATWAAPAHEHTRVRTVIPINHHAGGPTFTRCDVPASAGGFAATAEMLTPLAVVTGLEFQGIEHTTAAAAHVEGGCIDIRVGTQSYDMIEWVTE